MSIEVLSCRTAWQRMTEASNQCAVRNYVQLLDMSDFLVVSDVFPEDVLLAYSAYNMGKELNGRAAGGYECESRRCPRRLS